MKLGAEDDYPHRIVVPSRGPFGIALISRHPMKNVDVIHDDEGIAHIEADLEWQGRTLKAAAVHPMPPIEPRYQVLRDVKLRSLAQIADQGRPAIVVGDMNATPWSTAFDGLEERGLRRATGLKPSWPVVFGGIMGIPIDHVLVSDHWGLVDNEIGPDLASDHYPVIARLALRPISQHRQR
jgi:endonuclease/exonuclease/phosphatase (EEP) superfamily protein YafD